MCKECGCLGGGHEHAHVRAHEWEHGHKHGHDDTPSGRLPDHRLAELSRSVLERNDAAAARNRQRFRQEGLLVLNVLSSPGAGKTTLIRETARRASGMRFGVVVGDLATDHDAAQLRKAGLPAVQITTGAVCHLDAEMVGRAVEQLDLSALDVLVVENVGNLVCPADYDLGEDLRVVLLSVTEGEDKPLKYPPVFHSANAAIITKCDLAGPACFDRPRALANLGRISHHAAVFEVSAKTGAGMIEWISYLERKRVARTVEGGGKRSI